MISWLFSGFGRPWKVFGALLLLYIGCRWSLHSRGEPIWSCEGHPEHMDGKEFWLLAERVTAADAETWTLEVEPDRYRILIQAAQDTWPHGVTVGSRLYAHLRFVKGRGFVLEPLARVAPPQALPHLHLYLVSLPALAIAAALFLRRFRLGPDGLEARTDTDA